MTTLEVINLIMKTNTKVSISEKQLNWIKLIARKEGRITDYGNETKIYFDDCFYTIHQCKSLASGGSYVGTKLMQGRYNIERLFHIKFKNGINNTAVYGQSDIDHFNREKIEFIYLNPLISLKH